MTATVFCPASTRAVGGDDREQVFVPDELACEVVENFAALERIATEWERLWREHSDLSIFQNFRWLRAFWKAYGDELQVCSLVARREDHVVGILPLVLKDDELQFLGTPESDYNDVICRREHTEAVVHAFVRYLLKMPARWRSGFFANVAASSQLNQALQQLPGDLKRHFQTVFYMECPTIQLGHDREETLRRLLKKESLKRHENRLQKLGVLGFRHLDDRDEIRRHLENFFEQHTARHLMAHGGSSSPLQFQRPRSRAFYQALADELDPSSELRFAVLELDGRPVAYHFGFESKRSYLWYKPTFDVGFSKYSPGEVLLRNLLRYARDSELREFDFTIGDEQFKHRFANCRKENLAIYLERHPASVRSVSLSVARAGKGWLKRQPRLLNAARTARAWHTRISTRKR